MSRSSSGGKCENNTRACRDPCTVRQSLFLVPWWCRNHSSYYSAQFEKFFPTKSDSMQSISTVLNFYVSGAVRNALSQGQNSSQHALRYQTETETTTHRHPCYSINTVRDSQHKCGNDVEVGRGHGGALPPDPPTPRPVLPHSSRPFPHPSPRTYQNESERSPTHQPTQSPEPTLFLLPLSPFRTHPIVCHSCTTRIKTKCPFCSCINPLHAPPTPPTHSSGIPHSSPPSTPSIPSHPLPSPPTPTPSLHPTPPPLPPTRTPSPSWPHPSPSPPTRPSPCPTPALPSTPPSPTVPSLHLRRRTLGPQPLNLIRASRQKCICARIEVPSVDIRIKVGAGQVWAHSEPPRPYRRILPEHV